MEAIIVERGNGFPEVGAYVPGSGQLYRVTRLIGPIHTGEAGAGNYIHAEVEEADWEDCPAKDEFPSSVENVEDADVVYCDCGVLTGERCLWKGPIEGTVVVRYMPEWLRQQHRNAGYSSISGFGFQAGVETVRMERSCGVTLAEQYPDWVTRSRSKQ